MARCEPLRIAGVGVLVCLVAVAFGGCGNEGVTKGAINPADFVSTIDNPFLPLTPGTTFIYDGRAGGRPEHAVLVVTGERKTVIGVTCTVVRHTVTIAGQLAEVALDWYAQDRAGAVWYFGEDTREYRNGKVVSTRGSWEAGIRGARPGVVMEADPQVGDTYRQEVAKGVAEDMATVVSLTASIKVPFGSFTNCLKTQEFTPLEPGIVEYKWYARGVGNVRDDELRLVSVTH